MTIRSALTKRSVFSMISEEKTTRSYRIYDGKIISLRIDTVELPDQKHHKREIVEHPGAVAIVALTGEENIVLIRQFRKAVEKPLLEIPAGKIEKNEEPLKAAIRELKEETGYLADRMEYLTEIYTSPGFSDEKITLFFAKNLTEGETEFDSGENIDTEIYSLDACVEKIRTGEITDAKTIAGILAVKQFIIS